MKCDAVLKAYMPTLRHASSFLFDLIDPAIGLINAPGSLYVTHFSRHFQEIVMPVCAGTLTCLYEGISRAIAMRWLLHFSGVGF